MHFILLVVLTLTAILNACVGAAALGVGVSWMDNLVVASNIGLHITLGCSGCVPALLMILSLVGCVFERLPLISSRVARSSTGRLAVSLNFLYVAFCWMSVGYLIFYDHHHGLAEWGENMESSLGLDITAGVMAVLWGSVAQFMDWNFEMVEKK